MGRITELIAFLNMEKLPSAYERQFLFTHLIITDELMKLRREYCKQRRNNADRATGGGAK